ncbi:hypothetical protein Tco_1446982 [Tanacetum coccineum]|uniref:Uncharacterized protein n=1 Tax=Tanacetum coccineum TaxID=301880 RepID=A0ABQ5DIL4_9ASTR
MAHKRPKGWDAISRLLFRGGRNDIEHTPAPNPTKVKTGTRPRAVHEVPLRTATASRVIDMENTTVALGSSRTPSALEKSPLYFANENPSPLITKKDGMEGQVQDGLSREILPVENPTTTEVVLDTDLEKEVAAMRSLVNKRHRKRGNDEERKYTAQGVKEGSCCLSPCTESSRKTATEIPTGNVATTEVQGQIFAESSELGKSASFPSMDGSPGGSWDVSWKKTEENTKK